MKSALRRVMRARRKEVPDAAKLQASQVISREILTKVKAVLVNEKRVVAVYLASRVEIDLSPLITALIEDGIIVVAPRWNGATYCLARVRGLDEGDLRLGPMNIAEPKEAEIFAASEVQVGWCRG